MYRIMYNKNEYTSNNIIFRQTLDIRISTVI